MRDNKKYTVANIPLNRMVGTQNAVNPDYAKPKTQYSNRPEDLPPVYRVGGANYVTDGHHRLAAQAAQGVYAPPVRFYDVDQHLSGDAPDDSPTMLAKGGRARRAAGGGFHIPHHKAPGINIPKTTKMHVGPIHSAVAGRTDHLPMTVGSGSYVLPSDVVSSHGEGNTIAGFKVMRRTFGGNPYGGGSSPYGGSGGPYGSPAPHKSGGDAKGAGGVPIVAAGGEYVLSPEQVMAVGDGDLERGHRVLDAFVKRSRAKLVTTLRKLPGPAK